MAGQARGLVELTAGRPEAALGALRSAAELWQRFRAPYESARTRELIGLACRALADEDTARLELEAARETFARLGAAVDLARIEGPTGLGDAVGSHGLSNREFEVLRLLCAGKTNREIASDLIVSVRTVDRHVSNL